MKKNKNNIKEVDTSSTTSSTLPSTATTTSKSPEGTIFVKTADLKKPKIIKAVEKAKQDKVDIKVVEGTMKETQKRLEYISDVIDSKTGEVSKPFTIANKNYQMVRAMGPNREKVMGVYCMDEMNEDGTNKIYELNEFEEVVAKKNIDETGVAEPDAPEQSALNPYPLEEKEEHPSFAGYKHFIVNEKNGKARKFKSIEELAKANMEEGEKYMGVREFKRYVDETLFGPSRKQNVNEVTPTGQETDEEMNAKAKKLMAMIQKRIPTTIIDTIKTNKIAQREVIAAFAEMIGVPRNGLTQLVTGIKDLAKAQAQAKQQNKTEQPVSENVIIKTIKKKDIK